MRQSRGFITIATPFPTIFLQTSQKGSDWRKSDIVTICMRMVIGNWRDARRLQRGSVWWRWQFFGLSGTKSQRLIIAIIETITIHGRSAAIVRIGATYWSHFQWWKIKCVWSHRVKGGGARRSRKSSALRKQVCRWVVGRILQRMSFGRWGGR